MTRRLKRILSGFLSALVISSVLISTNTTTVYAAEEETGGIRYTTDSPLLTDAESLDIEAVDPYELECFALFMSNFTLPFYDNYQTAFSSAATTGSKGAGLQALNFSVGGDVNATSITRRFTTYVLDKMATTVTANPLVVRQYAINGSLAGCATDLDDVVDDASAKEFISDRQATLADLFPFIYGIMAKKDTIDIHPGEFNYNECYNYIYNQPWLIVATSEDKDTNEIQDMVVVDGVLADFYIASDDKGTPNTEAGIIWSTRNNWDIQIPSQLLYYTLNKISKEEAEEVIDPLLNNALNLPLYADSIGNIFVVKDNISYIIIPACINQHLTSANLINMVNAPMLNGLYDANSTGSKGLDVAKSLGGFAAKANGTGELSILSAGIASIMDSGKDTISGKSYLYNSAIDYSYSVLGINTDNMDGLTYAMAKFIDGGFDLEHLRWSSTFRFEQGSFDGFDIQNVLGLNATGFKPYMTKKDSQYYFNSEHVTKPLYSQMVGKLKNHYGSYNMGICMYAQISAQIYITAKNVPISRKQVLSDYIMLKTGSAETYSIFALTSDTSGTTEKTVALDSQDNKKFLIYTGIGQTGINHCNPGPNMLLTALIDVHHGYSRFNTDKVNEKALAFYIIDALTNKDAYKKNGKTVNSSYNIIKYAIDKSGLKDCDFDTLYEALGTNFTASIASSDKDYTNHAQNYVRILPASGALKIASQYLGLKQDTVFGDYADSMYYTYLYNFGFINNKTGHKFNSKLLSTLGNAATNMTPEDFADELAVNGLSQEEKEQQSRENAYLMLSTTKQGREYRTSYFSNLINDILSHRYTLMCYGDTDSEYYSTLLSTSSSFIKLDAYSENFMTRGIVKNWGTVLPLIVLFLSLFIAVFGTINGKKPLWIIANVFISALMLVLLPAAAEITPFVVEKVADNAFESVATMMSVSEAVEDDFNYQNIMAKYSSYGELATAIQAAYESQSSKSTSGSLMLKQDISRKVINATANTTYSELKGLATAQWLLPSIFEQESSYAEGEEDDYVYRSVGNKRAELRAMALTKSSISGDTGYAYLANNAALRTIVANMRVKAGYSTVGETVLADGFNTSIMDNRYGCVANRGASHQHLQALIYTTYNGSTSVGTYANLDTITDSMIDTLSVYDGTQSSYDNCIGYLQGTESILPYFYLIAYDTMANAYDSGAADLTGLTLTDFYYKMLPEDLTGADDYTNAVSYLKGKSLDVADMEYLLKFYIPYLVGLQETAKEQLGDNIIGSKYPIYAETARTFLYKCNWADKIVNSYGFGDDLDPYTYPSRYGREMIYSEAELDAYKETHTNFSEKDLTTVELRCIEANKNIAEKWLLLVNYVGQKNITPQILIEQMGFVATIEFNKAFAKDNIVNSNLALYPKAFTIRNINFDKMMKFVLMSNFNFVSTNQNSMTVILAEGSTPTGVLLLITAWLVTYVLPFLMAVVMGITFYATILSCAYNAAIDGKDKLKTCGGASITAIMLTGETALYIWSYRWVIGDTTRLLSTSQINSIAAGTTNAFGKVAIVLVFTILYGGIICIHAFNCVKNFKDMGFQMWASYSQKSFLAVQHGIQGLKNFIKPGSGKSDAEIMQDVAANDPMTAGKGGTTDSHVHNTPDDPLYVQETNKSDSSTYILPVDKDTDYSGYIEEEWDGIVPVDDSNTSSGKSKGAASKAGSNSESK